MGIEEHGRHLESHRLLKQHLDRKFGRSVATKQLDGSYVFYNVFLTKHYLVILLRLANNTFDNKGVKYSMSPQLPPRG